MQHIPVHGARGRRPTGGGDTPRRLARRGPGGAHPKDKTRLGPREQGRGNRQPPIRGLGARGAEMSELLLNVLGERLVNREKAEVDVQALGERVSLLGLFFGCGLNAPCRQFNGSLCDFYGRFKQTSEHRDKLEVVFVSSDPEQKQWQDFLQEMPWPALPFKDRHKKVRSGTFTCVGGIIWMSELQNVLHPPCLIKTSPIHLETRNLEELRVLLLPHHQVYVLYILSSVIHLYKVYIHIYVYCVEFLVRYTKALSAS